jgi:hypothetical protein
MRAKAVTGRIRTHWFIGVLLILIGSGEAVGTSSPVLSVSLTQVPEHATRVTERDTDGDGVIDLFRRWDASGRLRYLRQVLPDSQGGASRTVRTFWRAPDGSRNTWLVEESGRPIQQIEETRDRRGQLLERITLERAANAASTSAPTSTTVWTRRVWERRTGFLVEKVVDIWEAGSWRQVSRDRKPMQRLSALTSDFYGRYLDCAGQSDVSGEQSAFDCDPQMLGMDAEIEAILAESDPVSTSACILDGTTLRTESGYQIDLSSCADDQAVASLVRVTNQVRGESLSCLRSLNKAYAAELEAQIETASPMLYCSHPRNRNRESLSRGWCRQATDPADKAQCETLARSQVGQKSSESDGFTLNFVDDAIFLEGVDPTIKDSAEAAYGDVGIRNTVFHESLHLLGHAGCATHNQGGVAAGDDVYGCTFLCAPIPEATPMLSRESCEACIRGSSRDEPARSVAEGGNANPSAKLLADCAAFPTEANLKTLDGDTLTHANTLRVCAEPGADVKSCRDLMLRHPGYRKCYMVSVDVSKPIDEIEQVTWDCMWTTLRPAIQEKLDAARPAALKGFLWYSTKVENGRIKIEGQDPF